MKRRVLFFAVIGLSASVQASDAYINGAGSFIAAVEAVYTNAASTAQLDCTTCHTAVGVATLNTTFGADYDTNGGASGQNQSQIETVLNTITSLDSDSDGSTNAEEFIAGSAPENASSTPATVNDPGDTDEDLIDFPFQNTGEEEDIVGLCGMTESDYSHYGEDGWASLTFWYFWLLPFFLVYALRRQKQP